MWPSRPTWDPGAGVGRWCWAPPAPTAEGAERCCETSAARSPQSHGGHSSCSWSHLWHPWPAHQGIPLMYSSFQAGRYGGGCAAESKERQCTFIKVVLSQCKLNHTQNIAAECLLWWGILQMIYFSNKDKALLVYVLPVSLGSGKTKRHHKG